MLSKELLEIAKNNGYELRKELKNRMGYCYEYTLAKDDDSIYLGYKGYDDEYFVSEDEIIDRIQNGKTEEEELLNDYAEMIEKEMLA